MDITQCCQMEVLKIETGIKFQTNESTNQKKSVFEKYRLKQAEPKTEITSEKVEQKADDFTKEVTDSLSYEVSVYMRWIDQYQSERSTFIDKVFRIIKSKIQKHFVQEPEVS